MKHPSFKQLQDYFESEETGSFDFAIQRHMEQCDQCTKILEQMAKVDILFSKAEQMSLSQGVEDKIFSAASRLLEEKRQKIDVKNNQKLKRKERIDTAIKSFDDFKKNALSELKIPALQTAALSAFLILLTKYATTQTVIKNYKVISDDVQVITSELSGEEDEIY